MSNAAIAAPAEVAEHRAAQEQHRVLGEMLARSTTDMAFRKLMLADAHAAFAQFGADVPKSLDVVFIENQHDMTIVLPDAIDELVELDDQELAQLNGGSWTIVIVSGEFGTSGSVVSAIIGFSVSAVVATVAYSIAKAAD
jgi:hypothetical protein